ncbi:MAG: serine acetyltransferase [Deltaproteobacteria bacterium]|nr:MAG: serine acetyltransferase [Deltaproteobacteria bacterium]
MDSPNIPGRSDLAEAVERIVESYRQHGNINHLDGTNLPSRSEATELLDDLVSILFPGYFVQEQVDALTCRYFVGERCARVLRRLERAIDRALALGAPDAPAIMDSSERAALAHEHALALIAAIPDIRHTLDTDVFAAVSGDPAARSRSEVILAYPGVEAIAVHRLAHFLYRRRIPLLPRLLSEIVHRRTGIDIHPGANIGPFFFIDHGTGVVIGETCRIGAHVKIYQGVTLGALSVDRSVNPPASGQRHPTIEDHVTIYAGATILGGDTVIGARSIIGGNVWLTRSVPTDTMVILDNPSLRFVSVA